MKDILSIQRGKHQEEKHRNSTKHVDGVGGLTVPYEPWNERHVAHPLGVAGALFHMLKGSLGSGILSVPVAFKNAGLWTGLAGTVVIALLYAHCVHILVKSSHVLERRLREPYLGFAQIAEGAFLTGPAKSRHFAPIAKGCVDLVLFLGYYLCLVVYLLFTANSIEQVVELNTTLRLDTRLYIVMVAVIVLPLGMISNLKYLVPFSMVAVCVLMLGCCFVLYEVFLDLPPLSSRPAFTSISGLPIFFATIMYAFDGIGTVFPIENAMSNPRHFLGCPGVLNITVIWLTILYSAMGFFGYLRYGEDVHGTITLNISSSVLGQVVKIMVTLNVLCSYGLFFFVPSEITWRKLKSRINTKHHKSCFYAMKLVMVIGTVVLAAVIPNMQTVVSLVGAVTASSMVLLFPPIIEIVTFWEDSYCNWRLFKNLLLIVLWLIFLVTGVWLSVQDIILLYQEGKLNKT